MSQSRSERHSPRKDRGVIECKIRGPYLPVGDVDWECVRHEVNARLKEHAQARIHAGLLNPNEARKSDFYCPVGRIVESLAELGAVSEEQVEEIITAVLEEDRLHQLIELPTTYGTSIHEFVEQLNHEPQSPWTATFDRFYEGGGNHPVVYGGDANQRVQGVRAQYSFTDEASMFFDNAPADPMDLIGTQVSLTIQGSVAQFAASAARAAAQAEVTASAMKAVRKRAR